MKNIKLLIIAFLAISASLLTSCTGSTDDFAAPSIAFDNGHGTTTFAHDATLPAYYTVSGTVTAAGGLQEMTFWKDGTTFETVTTFDSDTATTFSFKVMKEDLQLEEGATVNKELNFKVQVKDKQDVAKTSEQAITITVEAAPVVTNSVGTYSGVTLTYTSTSLSATNMFSLASGTAIAANGTAADMDLAFCYQNTAEYSITSPKSSWLAELYSYNGITYNTSDKNDTKFAVSSLNFDSVDLAGLEAISATANSDLKNLTSGTVIEFVTASGKKGLMKLNIAKITKTISVDVKYVKDSSSK